jgi:hypothetical protein
MAEGAPVRAQPDDANIVFFPALPIDSSVCEETLHFP